MKTTRSTRQDSTIFATLAIAVAAALGLSTAAQAQYHYPATGSSSGGHYASSIHPIRAKGDASHAGVAPTLGQSRSNVGSRAPVNASAKPGYQYGQTGPTTISGPNGEKITLGGAQVIKGVNGKQITAGGASSMKGLHGQSYSAGVTHGPQRNANGVNPQGDHQGGVNINNGGIAGVSSGGKKPVPQFDDTHHIDPKTGKPVQDAPTPGQKDASDGKQSFACSMVGYGCGSKSTSTKVTDPRGVKFKDQEGGGAGDDPDIGRQGGGTLVSGTGKGIHPGHRPGQDGGRGPGTDGAPTGGGSNRNDATGAYVVTNKNGQDIPVKPKVRGPMTNSYNGVKGVTDPKKGGHAGGG